MLCGDLNGKEIQKRGDLYKCIADSLCYTLETNTTLQSNYTLIKINLKKKEKTYYNGIFEKQDTKLCMESDKGNVSDFFKRQSMKLKWKEISVLPPPKQWESEIFKASVDITLSLNSWMRQNSGLENISTHTQIWKIKIVNCK